MPQRVLLTGATGFVGSHTAEAFAAAGWTVRALARSRDRARDLAARGADVVIGSLADASALTEACRDVDAVVHMAALLHARSDAELRRVNVEGTRTVVRAALAATTAPKRLVYLSSLAAVGPSRNGRGVRGDDAPHPLTAYGRSKLEGERVCLEAADQLEVVILRAPAVYGPRDTDIYKFYRIARYGVFPVPTGPARRLQLVHVSDLAAALVRAAGTAGAHGVYHIAEPRAYTWEEVGSLVGEALGRRVRSVHLPASMIRAVAGASELAAAAMGRSFIFNRDKARELLAPGWMCDTDAARDELGFVAKIPLGEGLRTTAQWYQEHGWL
jgi:2-alkyl-3-oxoalkanoate reductase